MSRIRRYILLAISIVLMVGIATGVAFYTASYDPNNPDPGVYNGGEQLLSMDDTVMTIGEYDVSLAEYRYYYYGTIDYTEQQAAANGSAAPDWENDPDGELAYQLQSVVEQDLLNLYTWLAIADERGIELNEEELTEIEDTITQYKEDMGVDGFLAQVNDIFIEDEEAFRQLVQKQNRAQKAQEEVYTELEEQEGEAIGDEAQAEYVAENITAKHILFMLQTDEDYAAAQAAAQAAEDASAVSSDASVPTSEAVPDTSEVAPDSSAVTSDASSVPTAEQIDPELAARLPQEQTLARAQALYEQIIASEDPIATFDELMPIYTEDGGLESNPNGYTFVPDETSGLVEIFYTTAGALEEGEIAAPVLHDGADMGGYSGYHIIMRTPLDESAIEAVREQAISMAISEMLTAVYDEELASIPVEYSEYYEDISPSSLV